MNAIFWILHFLAIMFGFVLLFVTIPAHIIYLVVKGNNEKIAELEKSIKKD